MSWVCVHGTSMPHEPLQLRKKEGFRSLGRMCEVRPEEPQARLRKEEERRRSFGVDGLGRVVSFLTRRVNRISRKPQNSK